VKGNQIMSLYTMMLSASMRALQGRQNQLNNAELPILLQNLRKIAEPSCEGIRNVRARMPTGEANEIRGRLGWALVQLVKAGSEGCSSRDKNAPRWPSYVYQLKRKYELRIETRFECCGGNYPGRYARYVLLSPVTILDNSVNSQEETAR
jgi:hypothetical protein